MESTDQEVLRQAIGCLKQGRYVTRFTVARTCAGARLVTNPKPDRGMGTSLACGIAAAGDADAWLVGLADMPWIRPSTVRSLVDALREGARLVAPSYRGRRGHPVGFGAPLRDPLLQLRGDSGARVLLQEPGSRLKRIEVDDPGILLDVDAPQAIDRTPQREA